MFATLYRSYLPHITVGRLVVSGVEFATIERPWNENKRNVSCVPEGVYDVKHYSSERFPNVWEVQNVSGRSHILLHAGNSVDDVSGCIAVGGELSDLNYKITKSRQALSDLRALLPSGFTLVIKTNIPAGVKL